MIFLLDLSNNSSQSTMHCYTAYNAKRISVTPINNSEISHIPITDKYIINFGTSQFVNNAYGKTKKKFIYT